ncbi:MAG TPA: hypothetical protein VFW15_08105 [Thermoanaerobaculia bacterium]|nr:hypothetical protein [Thermoanaerobaculia bacterium]
MLLRRRIEIADPSIPGSRQPYHAAEEIGLPGAKDFLERCEKGSRQFALAAIRGAVAEIRKGRREVVASGLLLASGKPLGSVEDTLGSHAKIHTADGEHFRDAIARAAGDLGLSLTRVREKDLWDAAAKEMKVSAAVFQERIAALGKTLGPPWRIDEKLATAVGCLALALKPAR